METKGRVYNMKKIGIGLIGWGFMGRAHTHALRSIALFYPDIDFRVVRGQVEGVPVKPDPAGALAVARAMNVLPQEVLYLGDTSTDMRCALNAGMHPVGVLWGFRPEEELRQNGAECVISNPLGLLSVTEF